MQLTWETPLKNGGSMITGYIVERCEDGSDKWLRCNARLCPDLFYKVPRPLRDLVLKAPRLLQSKSLLKAPSQ